MFIRLTGCTLRCQYCDAEYAFNGGEQRYKVSLETSRAMGIRGVD